MSTAERPRLVARSRWSQAAKCARMASYGLLGIEPAEPSERQIGLRRRGRQLGAERLERYQLKYGPDQVIGEKEVPWPAGLLHTDIFVIPEKLAVEVKSSASPQSMIDDGLMQLAGEVYFDPDAEHGLFEIISPIDLQLVEQIPLILNEEWVEKVEAAAAAVVEAGATRGATLPDRVCGRPSDGISRFCPFIGHCFEGWQPPRAEEIDSAEGRELALALYEAKREYKSHSAEAEGARARYKEIEEQLGRLGIEDGRDYRIGPFQVRRIVAKGRETFSITTARKSGVWTDGHDEVFSPFMKIGPPSERWSIERVSDESALSPEDFGSEAPF